MTVRALRSSDVPELYRIFQEQGFAYEFPNLANMEAILVVADETGRPVMAAAAERLVQLYLFAGKAEHPALTQARIRMLDEAMTRRLKELGYSSMEAFLPPPIQRSFGRRLERTFGWVKNWPSWTKRF